MAKIEDGGPAFPVIDQDMGGDLHHDRTGLSLRDYFAAAAAQGMLAGGEKHASSQLARFAYTIADAMIAERAKLRS